MIGGSFCFLGFLCTPPDSFFALSNLKFVHWWVLLEFGQRFSIQSAREMRTFGPAAAAGQLLTSGGDGAVVGGPIKGP